MPWTKHKLIFNQNQNQNIYLFIIILLFILGTPNVHHDRSIIKASDGALRVGDQETPESVLVGREMHLRTPRVVTRGSVGLNYNTH